MLVVEAGGWGLSPYIQVPAGMLKLDPATRDIPVLTYTTEFEGQELDAEPQRVLMVGDTSHDLEMARNAGVDAVAVGYGAHPEQALRAFGPRACVASVDELVQWLTQNG